MTVLEAALLDPLLPEVDDALAVAPTVEPVTAAVPVNGRALFEKGFVALLLVSI